MATSFKPDKFAEVLYLGLRGERVLALQKFLNKVMPTPTHVPLTEDGLFGQKTHDRVVAYQTLLRYSPNGRANFHEMGALAVQSGFNPDEMFYNYRAANAPRPPIEGVDDNAEWVNLVGHKSLAPLPRKRKNVPLASPSRRLGIVLHHSATDMFAKGSNPWAFAATHVYQRNFPCIAYHLVVMPNGPVYQCLLPDEKGWHAGSNDVPGDENELYYGVCFVGNFSKEKMHDSMYARGVQALLKWTTLHRVFSGNSAWVPTFKRHDQLAFGRDCPGRDFPFQQMVTDVNLYLRGGRA